MIYPSSAPRYLYVMKRYVRPESDAKKTLIFILIAGTMMVLLDFAQNYMHEKQPPEISPEQQEYALKDSEIKDFETAQDIAKKMKPVNKEPQQVFLHVPQPEPIKNKVKKPAPVKKTLAKRKSEEDSKSKFYRQAKIAIIIDDIGMDRKRSQQAIDLDPPMTLAFLPYAPNLDEITARARSRGHELIIHTPMEPLNGDLNPGPMALLSSMTRGELKQKLNEILDSFEGYAGINNHMGSKLTQNEAAMSLIMKELARRDLYFVDSKTINTSLAADIAAAHGLDYAERDVFLDHENDINFVRQALKKTEAVARRNGVAIAIGHPRDATIQALKEWLPTLKKKGFTIVPVSKVVKNGYLAHKLGQVSATAQ